MKRTAAQSLAFAALAAASACAAADSGVDRLLSLSLEELMAVKVRISTSTEQTLAKAPSVVSVITAQDIKATGATNLIDVLQGVPGIYIRYNIFGNRPLIAFRGAAGTHALLMINGAPIKDLVYNSGIYWRGLPASIIDRVEIIRGPGSALYGSDASSGVINVITRTAGKITESEAGVRAGSFDTQSAWLQHGTEWNGFDLNFTADVSRTDSHRPMIARDNQTSRDGIGTNVSYAPGRAEFGWENQDIRFSLAREHWRLQADFMRKSNVAVGFVGVGVLDPVTRGGDRRYSIDLLYDNPAYAKDLGLNAEMRYVDLHYTSGDGFHERPPGFRCGAAPSTCGDAAAGTYTDGWINQRRSAERRLNLELSGLYTGIRSHAVRIGGGHMAQNLYLTEHYANYGKAADGTQIPLNSPLVNLSDSPYVFAPEKTRTVRYMFVQDVWTISPDWELTAGARYDDYSDFGGTTNPRLALVWQTTARLTTKLMYGQAFRAPSYLDLYAGSDAAANPALKPERSKTWDLGFSWLATSDLKLALDFFRFQQTDLIGVVSSKYQNIGTYVAHGVEAEAQWQATRNLRFSGSLSRRAEEDSPYRSFNVPKQTTYLRMDWAFLPGWNWNLQATRTGAHNLPTVATKPLGAYTLTDTTIRYEHGKHWEFAASMRNLFDVDAREYAGTNTTFWISEHLPLPGRNLYVEARYKF